MAHRIERVNQLLRREISELLQHQVKDPRLGSLIAVTDVEASADLKYAKVFVSCMSSDEEKKEILSGLASAAGFLRKELTDTLKLRRVPEFSFYWDDSIERGDHLLQLIDQVNSEPES